ncbi:two-component system sensor histidine kinase NtrB [Dendrosporobacter sp. 1207_IL3150]|uniref:two-component system sensor histidine kinase NtrB n=1 Tax=Dendrosporobacter sp. 1207_IL3150 TaxID=3084054 RepID=UPI002FDA12D6
MYSTEALSNKVMYLRDDEYKEYFDTTTTGVIYLDAKMRVKNLNREAERICSIERAQILGRRADVVFSEYGDRFLKIFSIAEYDDLNTTNLKVKIKDQYVYLHVDTLKLLDSDGEVSGIIVILQDVSAVRAAIKQIQTTQMLMSLGELAAGVAHHVRTPLTTISGYLQVMLNRLDDDNKYMVRREILDTMLEEVSYINGVVKELVMFAKPAIEKNPGTSINSVIDEALLLVFKQLGGDNIAIKKQLAKELPTICGDGNLLQQAIVNIMQNAMEAMPEEGELSVKSWLNAEINMIVIAINDTGAGVTPEILPRVFEPFYTTKIDRMGLGLPVAHRIITEHGGFINISAGNNGGTKVHIYLPLFDDKIRHLTVVHQQILNLQ